MELEPNAQCFICAQEFNTWNGGTRIEIPETAWTSWRVSELREICVPCTVQHVLPGITLSIEG